MPRPRTEKIKKNKRYYEGDIEIVYYPQSFTEMTCKGCGSSFFIHWRSVAKTRIKYCGRCNITKKKKEKSEVIEIE
jgi:hypothetical protein